MKEEKQLSPDIDPKLKNRFNEIESSGACGNCSWGIHITLELSSRKFGLSTFSASGTKIASIFEKTQLQSPEMIVRWLCIVGLE